MKEYVDCIFAPDYKVICNRNCAECSFPLFIGREQEEEEQLDFFSEDNL